MRQEDLQLALKNLLNSNLSYPFAFECLRAIEEAERAVDCREQGLSEMTHFLARLRKRAEGVEGLYEGLIPAPAGVPIVSCGVGEPGRRYMIFADAELRELYGILKVGPEPEPAAKSEPTRTEDGIEKWPHDVKLETADGTIVDGVLMSYTRNLGKRDWVCVAEIDVGGESFAGEGSDHFEAMAELCKRLRPAGIKLLCFGARRDVWVSGMGRDMGGGTQAYLFSYPREDFKPMQSIYDPAPPDTIGTVEEQREYFERWSDERTRKLKSKGES